MEGARRQRWRGLTDLVKKRLKVSSWGRRQAGVAKGSVVIAAWLNVELQGEAEGVGARQGQGGVEAWCSRDLVVVLWHGTRGEQ